MKERLLQVLPHVAAIVVFITISCIYFSPVLDGYHVRQHDIETYQGMSKEIRDFSGLEDEETLWTGGMFAGMPTYQIHAEHPGNWLKHVETVLRLGMPRPISILFVAMLGFYILCQCIRINPWLGILGAVAFGLASWNILYIGAGHMSKVNSVAYMAPALGGLLLMFRGKLWLGAAVLALFTGLQISANHFQMTYYLLFLMLFVGLGESVRIWKQDGFKPLLKIGGLAIGVGLLAVLPNYSNLTTTHTYSEYSTRGGTELTMDADGVELEVSEGLSKDYILEYSMGGGELWQLLIPNIKGGRGGMVISDPDLAEKLDLGPRDKGNYVLRYWGEQKSSGGAFYYGAVMFLLFVLGMVLWKSATRWFVLALVVIALLLSLKDAGALTDFFLNVIPYYAKFRDTKMMLVIVQVLVPMVGMIGLHELLFSGKVQELKKPAMMAMGAVTVVVLAIAMAPSSFFDMEKDSDEQMHQAYLGQQIQMSLQQELMAGQLNITTMEQYQAEYDKRLNPLVDAVMMEVPDVRAGIVKADATRTLLFILGASLVILAFLFGKVPAIVVMGGLGLLAVIDLYQVDQRYLNNEKNQSVYNHYVKAVDRLVPYEASPGDLEILGEEARLVPEYDKTVKALTKVYHSKLESNRDKKLEKVALAVEFGALNLRTNYRVLRFSSTNGVSKGELTGDGKTPFFHKSLSGYHGAKLKRYQEVMDFHLEREMEDFLASANQIGVTGALNGMQVFNMLNTKYLLLPDQESGGTQAVMNVMNNGPAWFVREVELVDNADDEITQLGEILTKETALVDQRFSEHIPASLVPDSTSQIFMDTYAPNRISYFTSAAEEQVALFSEMWYPEDWQAYIDTEPVPHFRANYLLRGLTVPAGEHEIVFSFEPEGYANGNVIAAMGSALVLLLVFVAGWFTFRERKQVAVLETEQA